MLNIIWMYLLGILGASNIIIAKKPDAKDLIAKIQPIQGWLGAISAIWGAWLTVNGILSIGTLSGSFIWMIAYFCISGCLLLLGFLLGLGVLKTFVKDSSKMDELAVKLSPWQGTLGLISIGVATFGLLIHLGIL